MILWLLTSFFFFFFLNFILVLFFLKESYIWTYLAFMKYDIYKDTLIIAQLFWIEIEI